MASPDIRRLRLERAESQSDDTEQDSTEADEEFGRAIELGLPLPAIEEELESLTLTLRAEKFMNTEDDTYAAKAKTILAPTPVIATTTMVEHPTRVIISGGGLVPESGSVQGTSGLALVRGPSRGKASRRIGPGIVQASSGQASGSQTTTGTVVQSGRSAPTGNPSSGSGLGSGQTGGQVLRLISIYRLIFTYPDLSTTRL